MSSAVAGVTHLAVRPPSVFAVGAGPLCVVFSHVGEHAAHKMITAFPKRSCVIRLRPGALSRIPARWLVVHSLDSIETPLEQDLGNGLLRVSIPTFRPYPDWSFRVDTQFTAQGIELGPVQARRRDGVERACSNRVLEEVATFVRRYLGAGDLDPVIATVAALVLPDPRNASPHQRAEAAALVYELELARFELARQMGKTVPGEKPRPRRAIAKAFHLPFGTSWETVDRESVAVVDEADPSNTVDHWIHLARTLLRPGTDQPYLPAHNRTAAREPAAGTGPEAAPVITLFAWRSEPRARGDDAALPAGTIGPDVLLEAQWTDLRRHLEDRPTLPVFQPLLVVSPAELPQRIMPLLGHLSFQFPEAVVRAAISRTTNPPEDFDPTT
ncbi:hypothetical protein [Allokutzneria sp. NRRL B-24872]|uniref:hypothetical protein n=1 Tax=Allokutzneria sp. NRRL B-24872 TaxID=1137961 RepID=UPI001AEF7902|nr:hypothetical protein [Allokutzneria sp. NRRL B-24872]